MLIWSAIVKNERKILSRCLASILPNVDGAVIVDTGSTDGTPEFIKQCFKDAKKPIEIKSVPFENFAQARNAALKTARESKLAWDYLLLADADMELVVEAPIQLNGGLSYDMWQTAGGMRYLNRRIVNRSATGWYRGVTHEYLDVASAGCIDSAYFIDHADGANRPGKLERDIALLEKALETELEVGLIGRYCFYLGQSYFDLNNWDKAAEYYHRRLTLGGFEEECWFSLYKYAQCLKNMGRHAEFVWSMLEAYERRPQRVEAFYELARFFRELKGGNLRSLLFSDISMGKPRPDDALFVNDYVYKTGMKEEFSICAYYDEGRRRVGAKICNRLALDREGTDFSREQARSNLFWYLRPLSEQVPSFKAERIKFTPPDGYVAMNPSIINHNGEPLVLVRTVNYAITAEGYYVSRTGNRTRDGTDIIITRNFLVSLRDNGLLDVELRRPRNWPATQFELVRGFEDSRLFDWKGEFWTLSTVRELAADGLCEQVLAPIVSNRYGDNWVRIASPTRQHEKNWMPWVKDSGLQFVYRLGTLIDPTGKIIHQSAPKWATDHISGGTQVIKVGNEYLALVHEARLIPGRPNRYYQHRFVKMDEDGSVLSLSEPFFFHDRQIEFAAGLALFGKTLMVSYGIRDEEAWVATIDANQVLGFCG